MADSNQTLVFEGEKCFAERCTLSVLSGKPIKIKKIRSESTEPGISAFEVNFLELLKKVTDGTMIIVSRDGTTVKLTPGIIYGGTHEHDCGTQQSIAYFLEVLLWLAPFGKESMDITLTGVTNTPWDSSVDMLKHSSLPVLQKAIVIDEGLKIDIKKRGVFPEGGGEVHFTCKSRDKLRPITLTEEGKIKRIRGVSWCTRVSAGNTNRMIESARAIINRLSGNVYIYADVRKGKDSGKSPGYGILLSAEMDNGQVICVEKMSNPRGQGDQDHIEADEIGTLAATELGIEIANRACVTCNSQPLALLMMALGDNVSKLSTGPITKHSSQLLRHIKQFFNIKFDFPEQEEEEESNDENEENDDNDDDDDEEAVPRKRQRITAVCKGIGMRNVAKRML